MKKQFFIVLAVLAMASFSFAQNFGARVSGGLNGLSGDLGEGADMGFHVGAGAFMLQDLGFATLNVGANILYKKVAGFEESESEGGYKYSSEESLTEIGIDIPVLLRFSFDQIYVEVGPQINFAISPEWEWEYKETSSYGESESDSGTEKFDDRATLDFGITAGLGYKINEKMSVDARFFYGINNYIDASGAPDGGLYQITFGFNYVF